VHIKSLHIIIIIIIIIKSRATLYETKPYGNK